MSDQQTRREFGRDMSVLALGGAWVIPIAAASESARAADTDSDNVRPACDFQRSFMTWNFVPTHDPRPYARHDIPFGNMARIQLEALADVIDDSTGKSERYVLIAACRTEWVYAKNRLFQIPSGEYRNVYSLTEERSLGSRLTASTEPTQGTPVSTSFESLKIEVHTFPDTLLLKTPDEIVKAVGENLPLVARTEIRHPNRKLRYILEYPIRTMNFQPKTNSFQVDTGPILTPDFNADSTRHIDTLQMAHVAYNRLDRAEFILRRPTPITNDEGDEVAHALHFSEVREDAAVTRMLCSK